MNDTFMLVNKHIIIKPLFKMNRIIHCVIIKTWRAQSASTFYFAIAFCTSRSCLLYFFGNIIFTLQIDHSGSQKKKVHFGSTIREGKRECRKQLVSAGSNSHFFFRESIQCFPLNGRPWLFLLFRFLYSLFSY